MEDESALADPAGPETVVEAPEGEEEGQVATPPADGEEPKEEKSESAKRRERDKAHRERLRTERDEALAKAADADRRRQAILNAGKAEQPPKEADFDDPIEFAVAKGIWGSDQSKRERDASAAGAEVKAAEDRAREIDGKERQVLEQSWAVARDEAKTRYADFETVALSGWEPSPVMTDLILTSDVGPDVAYHLGQNRDLAAQIARMSAVEAARAIGRIEASLQLPKPRMSTNAPPPISPVRGGASVTKDPAKMTLAEFSAWRSSGGAPTL